MEETICDLCANEVSEDESHSCFKCSQTCCDGCSTIDAAGHVICSECEEEE